MEVHFCTLMCKMSAFENVLILLIATNIPAGCFRNHNYNHNFMAPIHLNDEGDIFLIGDQEYLFVSEKVKFPQAILLCRQNYEAELAFVKDFQLAKTLAEALSETDLFLDSLWIAARQKKKSEEWNWIRDDTSELVNQTIVDNFTYNPNVIAHDRKCLSFGRTYHDEPQFRPITCRARRALLCERPRSRDKNTTHPGWIQLGKRFYKIFQDRVSWDIAIEKCYEHDSDSSLAVVITSEDANQLGRYMLIGRPSLENAWIGGRWIGGHYMFEDENIILSNKSDSSNYPPWINKFMRKPLGCLLLDRHLTNFTAFVEAKCRLRRPYICYKMNKNESKEYSDVIIEDDGYRLLFQRKSWIDSRDHCRNIYKNYSSNLVEIRKTEHVSHLLYVMGENKTAVSHLWIGGQFNKTMSPPAWLWDTDFSKIETGPNSILEWVRNSSYNPGTEEDNICLTMDRENHIVALHYGTICRYEQNFVCHFSAEKLRQLENDEAENQTDIYLE